MREEEDNIGHYVPVLRRIIILVAVITAIPVAMWTITAFMRTYVGQPRLPSFQPVSAATATVPEGTLAAAKPVATVKLAKTSPPPIVEANATGGAAAPAAGTPGTNTPDGAAAPAGGPAPMAAAAPILGAPVPASANGLDTAPAPQIAQAPAAAWPAPPAVDGTPGPPAVTPAIAERIPLPRKRPRMVKLVQAQGPIPLPRPRPEAAGPVAPPPAATPLDFFRNIFQHNDVHNDGASNPPPFQDAAVPPTNSVSVDR